MFTAWFRGTFLYKKVRNTNIRCYKKSGNLLRNTAFTMSSIKEHPSFGMTVDCKQSERKTHVSHTQNHSPQFGRTFFHLYASILIGCCTHGSRLMSCSVALWPSFGCSNHAMISIRSDKKWRDSMKHAGNLSATGKCNRVTLHHYG